jgi:hypothetical protein
MKLISEKKALVKLSAIRSELKCTVAMYEARAKRCESCSTPGACCLDEHFVNVHISRIEAAAIVRALDELPPVHRRRVHERIEQSIEKYGLAAGVGTYERTYACPLYERHAGCLVHNTAKPVPCIVHACYEMREDLPPDEIQFEAEEKINELNLRTYGRRSPMTSLPVALQRAMTTRGGEGYKP